MKYIGAHVSIGGGVGNAPLNAKAIGATAFAMFTKNERQWNAPPFTEEAILTFKKNCADNGYNASQILPHDSYLINLGGPDPEKRKKAVAAFTAEMARCQALGLTLLNFHPGSHLNAIPLEESLRYIAEGINQALEETEGVTAVLENTAGQGSNVGFQFRHLADIMAQVKDQNRVGVCLDTCHLYGAGYDLKGNYDGVFEEFEKIIGFRYLRGMHLNDSKGALNSRLDRHHSLGEGELGWEPFKRLMADTRLDGIPLVLETIDPNRWAEEIRQLRMAVK